jgi:hypothetical protein
MNRNTTATLNACGEHYVAAYLSRKELIVALPSAHIPGTDLFVSAPSGGRPIRVQVKTGTQSTSNDKVEGPIYLWATSAAITQLIDEQMWFAFVWLKTWPEDLPEIFFVPQSVVADCMNTQTDSSYPSFWMRAEVAERYRGEQGFRKLREALAETAV